jgi:site-specific recombinase XerC
MIRRHLLTCLSALSLILCVGTVGLWVRSYWPLEFRLGRPGLSAVSMWQLTRISTSATCGKKAAVSVGNDEGLTPRFHPHQLRHNAAANFRRSYGIEAAQVMLGQKTLGITEIYAEKNEALAERIVAEVG